ncbi:SHOCT domain-containing protein [Sinomonas cellulolyticus]|nr:MULTISPECIES: SHOCT domain-containing protein [Sinomonas]
MTEEDTMMYGWYGGAGVWGWVVMGIVMLLFWGGVAAVVVLLVRGSRGGWGGRGTYPPGPQQEDPEHILAQRFARGEIDETEYRARLDALRRRP